MIAKTNKIIPNNLKTVNSALNSAKLHSQSKMMEITGGIDLDGLL